MQIVKNSNVLAFDPTSSVKNLKNLKNIDNKENAKEVSEQLEALFLQMVLKSMREATSKDELFSGDQSENYVSMFDQQLAYNMSKANGGVGLASQIEKQIMKYMENKNVTANGIPLTSEETKTNQIPNFTKTTNNIKNNLNSEVTTTSNLSNKEDINNNKTKTTNIDIPSANINKTNLNEAFESLIQQAKSSNVNTEISVQNKKNKEITPKSFIRDILKDGLEASSETGVPPQFILGHAALESGWGKYIPQKPNGDSSFNIFSVKANKDWKGETVDVLTTEYINGKQISKVDKFKAYGSYSEAFKDYVSTLKNNSRYESVFTSETSSDFARNLQKSGYATDPQYANKLEQVINGNRLKQSINS